MKNGKERGQFKVISGNAIISPVIFDFTFDLHYNYT